MSFNIKRIVIDSLKPRETMIVDLSKALCAVKGVNEVNVTVTEVDVKTETIKLTIKGTDVDYEELNKVMNDYGAIVRSIDEIDVCKVENNVEK